MHILLLTQYYKPESVGAAIWLSELVDELTTVGHEVTVLTGFPNHPTGRVFEGYGGKFFQREAISGTQIIRTWLYATPRKTFWARAVGFFSFTISSLLGGLIAVKRADVIYTILQPLTLGMTAVMLAKKTRARVVLNIQDIHPQAAVAVGALRNRRIIRCLEWLERWNYRHADHMVVISEGFRQNLIGKGVPAEKVSVVPNWADPGFIQPGPKDNDFRQEINVGSTFTLVYSGGLTHNSNLEPVIEAAQILRNDPFSFVIVGDGVRKADLQQLAQEKNLSNVQFKPFQPLERYPDVLRAADMNLVTLSTQAALVSVPSKIFKQMAAGRPVLAIAAKGTLEFCGNFA